MELYHVHLKGNFDRLYKEKSEFVIDKDLIPERCEYLVQGKVKTLEKVDEIRR